MRKLLATLVVLVAFASVPSTSVAAIGQGCVRAPGDNGCVEYVNGVATFYGYDPFLSIPGFPFFSPGPFGTFTLRHDLQSDILIIRPGVPGQPFTDSLRAHIGPGSITFFSQSTGVEVTTPVLSVAPVFERDTINDRLSPFDVLRVSRLSLSMFIPQLPPVL